MSRKIFVDWKLSAIAALACFTATLLAHGFRLPDQDAFATARGEAFAATADNASAVYYNPAGLGQVRGSEMRAGAYGLDFDLSYESPSGQSFHNRKDLHAIHQIFYAY